MNPGRTSRHFCMGARELGVRGPYVRRVGYRFAEDAA
jgi:hypothetical protein